MRAIESISLEDIRRARERLPDGVVRTPLLKLPLPETQAEIYLKLENLQPIGSFKLRGAGNALASAPDELLGGGVYTASAGNMAQGVAWNARLRNVPCTVIVPEHAPDTKCRAVERLGGSILKVPYDQWWKAIVEHGCAGMEGLFVHPVSEPAVIAGNGTIGLEIQEDLPDVDTVLVPYGGGGLSCGIAAAVKGLNPSVRVCACEIETGAPLAASLQAGEPVDVSYSPSFVDGAGSKGLLREMWPLARRLLDASIVVSLQEAAAALRLMAERCRVIAEGAGALALAAALSGRAGAGKIVCVVSGGNIDSAKLCSILAGELPD